MLSLSGNQARVVSFSPRHWGEVDRFAHFCSTTYKFDQRLHGILGGVAGHFGKVMVLMKLAQVIEPDLKKDREELNAKGFTSNEHGARLAAIVETIFCELYSSVDCARQIVAEIYSGFQGVTSKSTRRFFQNAADGILDHRLPALLRSAFEKAKWYNELRRVRDAVIHSDVGLCHLDEKTGEVSYFNSGIQAGGKCFHIEDVFQELGSLRKEVNEFEGSVFHALNQTLSDEEIPQICGYFGGRVYTRIVRPSEAIDFGSGRCDAFTWFEKEQNPRCPFAEECGAYRKVQDARSP